MKPQRQSWLPCRWEQASQILNLFLLPSAGAKAEIEGVEQVSGVTENDFSNPVVYTIKSEDGATIAYTVNVAAVARCNYLSAERGVDRGCKGMGSAAGGGSL